MPQRPEGTSVIATSVAPALTFEQPARPGLVSVIVPTYNRAWILPRAIDSALRQTYADIEVIVVDDGSVDDTASVVHRYDDRVRYVRQVNGGVASARNTGLTCARGEYIAFLDSDDAWLEWKVAAQVAALRARPDVGLVWTDMTAIDPDGVVAHERYLRMSYDAYRAVNFDERMPVAGTLADVSPSSPRARDVVLRVGDLSSDILLGNLLHTSTVMVRRAWVEKAGALQVTWSNGEDYEYYTRLCALGPVMLIDVPSILYRIGAEDQLTAPEKLLALARNNLRTLRARLVDRRGRIDLPRSTMRRRLASSLEWLGTMEFVVGQRLSASRHLAHSLRVRPRLDRRVLLLAACALPRAVVDGVRSIRRRVPGRHTDHPRAAA